MSKIGVLKNRFHPSGWQNCDWTNRMKEAIGALDLELDFIDNPSLVDEEALFYLTRLNHDAGHKNSEKLSKKLEDIALHFENKRSSIFPSSYLYRLYENKKNIFFLFDKCGVKHPQTWFFDNIEEALNTKVSFPVVIKHPYSCASNFMEQAKNIEEYRDKIRKIFNVSSECIVQQKIMFTKEARLTFVGDEVVHGYFRIKKDQDSLSGSTRFGSVCDFDIDLKEMSNHIKKFRKLTNINIGACDVAWENDDLTVEPHFFEVSPIFSMNVPGPVGSAYKSFKGTAEFKVKERQIQLDFYKKVIQFLKTQSEKPVIYCDIDYTINDHVPRVRKWTNSNGSIDPRYGDYDEIMLDLANEQAREILNDAKEKYRIVFITARGKFNNAYLSTRDWLIKNNFHYDQIIIVDNFEQKLDILKSDHKTHLFIDDLTRGHHTDNIEVKKDNVKKLIYFNIPFIRYDNNWSEIKEALK